MRLKPVAVLFHRNRSIRQPPPGASCSLLLTDRLLRSSPGEGGGLACSSSGSTNGLHCRAPHHPRQVFLRRVIGILPDASSCGPHTTGWIGTSAACATHRSAAAPSRDPKPRSLLILASPPEQRGINGHACEKRHGDTFSPQARLAVNTETDLRAQRLQAGLSWVRRRTRQHTRVPAKKIGPSHASVPGNGSGPPSA